MAEPVMVSGEGLVTTREGTWAQAAVILRGATYGLPDRVQTRDAAPTGVVGSTAQYTVCQLGGIDTEDRLLVLGAAWGVGGTMVSCPRHRGTVWGLPTQRRPAT